MLKKTRPSLSLLALALLTAGVSADTITLKTGERIDAKIASETATEMTLELQVSAGIKDERVVKKADVVKIDRVAPDETAYRAIMNLQPGKNSLLPAQYDAILAALQDFAAKYPESSHLASVNQAVTAFQADKKRADAGEVKFEGTWLSKDEALRQRVQIGGLQALNAMKNANAAGDAIGALNAFANLEKNFGGARVLPDAIELARQILPALRPATERALENQKINEAARELGVKNASPLDRPDLIAASQREQAQASAALTAATAAGLWPPFAVNSEKCLRAILARITTEAARLEKIPLAPMRESIALAERAQTEFANKDLAAAAETLKEVTKLWPANELGTRLTAQIAAAKNPPKPDPAATPAPATPATARTGAATPAPKATPATAKPASAPATKPAPPAPTASDEASEPVAAEPADPPKSFFMTLPGAISIVVALAVLLAGANIFSKMRQRSSQTEE